MPFVVGETIGPYRLVEQLGQGGMATVYKAYHAALDRYVAIKALHPALLEDAGFLARFQREAHLVARLEHPNIIPIYDFSEHEGRPYLVMKYIKGQTLKAYLAGQRLEMREILRIVEAVGAALAYAHQQSVLHRDIKPSNVLLTDDGQIYLADFGLARIAAGSSSTMSGDMLIGTPQYISPEQASSRSDLDARTDIYSFGVMLYEMVVGQVPFSSDTPFSVIHDHIYTPLPMPRRIRPEVPEVVERVLLKALAKDRQDRFQSVTEMVEAFRAAATGTFPELASQPGGPPGNVVHGDWWRVDSETGRLIPHEEDTEPVGAEKAAEAAPPPSEQIIEQPPLVQPAGAGRKKGRSRRWIIAALVVVAIGILSLLLFGGVRQIRKRQAWATQTAQAQAAMAAEPTRAAGEQKPPAVALPEGLSGLSPAARVALLDMIIAWKGNNLPVARQSMEMLCAENNKNPDTIIPTQQYLEDQEAWLLAAMYGALSYDLHPGAYPPDRLDRLHMAIYRSARDERYGEFLSTVQEKELFRVANLRHRLYYGGEIPEVQGNFERLMADPPFVGRFPEIRLLEVEIAVKAQDNQRARSALRMILEAKELPEWVKEEARLLQAQKP